MLAGALVVVDAACPTVNVKTHGPAKVKAGKPFTYRVQVTLPQAGKKGSTIDATTLQLDLPAFTAVSNKTKAIRVFSKRDDVEVNNEGSRIMFKDLEAAKKHNFKVQVRLQKQNEKERSIVYNVCEMDHPCS